MDHDKWETAPTGKLEKKRFQWQRILESNGGREKTALGARVEKNRISRVNKDMQDTKQKEAQKTKPRKCNWVYTCRRHWGVVLQSVRAGNQTPWRESDVIQADVALWTSAHFALKHDLEVSRVAQRDLPHLPVVALVSWDVQQEMQIPFTFHENAEGPDAVSRHVQVETHLKSTRKEISKK